LRALEPSWPLRCSNGRLDGAIDMRAILAIMLSAAVLAGCTPDSNSDITGAIDNCARKLYNPYNPKNLKQCIAVCLSCQNGAMTTCSTSCTLKGAQ
jgi:hypothetical protein